MSASIQRSANNALANLAASMRDMIAESHGAPIKLKHLSSQKLDAIEASLIEAAEAGLFQEPEVPLMHFFVPGMYVREVFMPRGSLIVSMEHKTSELNLVPRGKAIVRSGDDLRLVEGPCSFESEAGIRKILFILEDTVWQTAHMNPDDTRDIELLKSRLVVQTPAHRHHQEFLQASITNQLTHTLEAVAV